MGEATQGAGEVVHFLGEQLPNYSLQKIASNKHGQAPPSWKIMIQIWFKAISPSGRYKIFQWLVGKREEKIFQ